MASNGSASFERHFQDLPDPRIQRARKHPLINIVFMAVCGVLSGSDSIAGIHEFAFDRRGLVCSVSGPVPGRSMRRHIRPRLGPDRSGGVREMSLELDRSRPPSDRPSTDRHRRQDAARLAGSGEGPFGHPHGLGLGRREQAVAGPGRRAGEVQRDHGDSGTAPVTGDQRGLDHDRRDGLPEGDRRPDPPRRRRLRLGRQAESAQAL